MMVMTCLSEHEYDDAVHDECPTCAAHDAAMYQKYYAEWELKQREDDFIRMNGNDPRTMAYWERYL